LRTLTDPALAVQPGATLYVDVGAPGSNNSNNESLCPSNASGGLRDGGAGGSGCGDDFGGGGGGGAGSSYLGVEVSGASAASTVTTATSQASSVVITWSLISLVFSGGISADLGIRSWHSCHRVRQHKKPQCLQRPGNRRRQGFRPIQALQPELHALA
jgi:hypothetical protein